MVQENVSDTTWSLNQLEDVSRTFSFSIQFLEEPVKTYLSISYLLCRIPDTIEDSPGISSSKKIDLLVDFKRALNSGADSENVNTFVENSLEVAPENAQEDSHWELLANTNRVFSAYEEFPEDIQLAIEPPVFELVNGMLEFVRENSEKDGVRIQDIQEFETYCYYAAGTVGKLVTNVIINNSDVLLEDELVDWAKEYGILLQSVNISKDVYDDYETEDSIYLPVNRLRKHEVEPENITKEENVTDVGKVVKEILDQTRPYMGSAKKYLQWVKTNVPTAFEAVAVPYFLSVATRRKVINNLEQAASEEEIKISRSEVFEIAGVITAESYEDLHSLEERIKEGEFTST